MTAAGTDVPRSRPFLVAKGLVKQYPGVVALDHADGAIRPGVVLGLYSKRVTTPGVFAGMVTGVFIVVLLMLSNHDPIMGLNAGFIALCFNFAVTGVVSLLTSKRESGFVQDFVPSGAAQSGGNTEHV